MYFWNISWPSPSFSLAKRFVSGPCLQPWPKHKAKVISLNLIIAHLKANENFLQLQAQLEGTENRISVERMKFTQRVQEYNTRIRQFPANIIAGVAGFTVKPNFSAQPGADQAPKVEF